MSHAPGEISFRCFNQQVIVVVHETVGMTKPVKTSHRVPKELKEKTFISPRRENLPPSVAAAGDMIDGSGILNA